MLDTFFFTIWSIVPWRGLALWEKFIFSLVHPSYYSLIFPYIHYFNIVSAATYPSYLYIVSRHQFFKSNLEVCNYGNHSICHRNCYFLCQHLSIYVGMFFCGSILFLLVLMTWAILTSTKCSHRLAGRSPASLWAWWTWRVMTRSHQRWTWSPATSPQVPELSAKLSTMVASPAAGSTTQTSQTPFLRGMSSQELYKSNLKVKSVQYLTPHMHFQKFLCVCTHD